MSIRATINVEVVEASVSASVPEASIYHTLLTASDIYTDPLSGNRSFTQPVLVSDLNILVVQKELSDPLGVSDTHLVVVEKLVRPIHGTVFNTAPINRVGLNSGPQYDSVRITDAPTYQLTARYTDPVVLAELISNNPTKNITDTVASADYAVSVVGKPIEEFVGTSDIFARTVEYNRLFTDGFALDDATLINKDYSGTKGNVFAFSDSNSWGVTKGVADTVASSDYAASFVGKDIGDSVGTSDTSSYQLNTQQGDAVSITDLISIDHRASSVFNATKLNIAILNS